MSTDDPQSWNRYTYVTNDPTNKNDPTGLEGEPPTGCTYLGVYYVFCPNLPGPGKPSDPGLSSFPECNPYGKNPYSPTVEKELNMIYDDYADAETVANGVEADMGKTVDTSALTTMFLQWSMWESGRGTDPANVAENNYFGVQNAKNTAGLWGGATVTCVRDGNPIKANSTNACFASNITWGEELGISLSIVSSKTGITYLSALETALGNGANMAQALQAIGNNGWNGNPNYGSTIMGININGLINCMKKNGYI